MLHRTQQLGIDPDHSRQRLRIQTVVLLAASPISRILRGFATITSCPHSLSKGLIQGECVPVSSAIRLRRHRAEDLPQGLRRRTDSLLQLDLDGFIHHAIPTVAIGPNPVGWSVSAEKKYSCSPSSLAGISRKA
jgi:hypothetical protein